MRDVAFLLIALILTIALCFLVACQTTTVPTTSPDASSSRKLPDAVQKQLRDFAGATATNCGRLAFHTADAQFKAASDCALQANQNKRPFYVAYDMPGMTVGVAGNADGKLFSVQLQGEGPSAVLNSGDCPSDLRLAASGRVTCFAPGDMGGMGGGHTAIPPGMPNPHAFPKTN